MNSFFVKFGLLSTLFVADIAFAVPLNCYQDNNTDAVQCVDDKKITEKDGIRSATLYAGGPKQIVKTDFTVHVNCGTNVMHLKDRQGVSFAGSSASATTASYELRNIICGASIATAKGKK